MQMHPDRGDMMQNGTAGQVTDYLEPMLDIFDTCPADRSCTSRSTRISAGKPRSAGALGDRQAAVLASGEFH